MNPSLRDQATLLTGDGLLQKKGSRKVRKGHKEYISIFEASLPSIDKVFAFFAFKPCALCVNPSLQNQATVLH
jgi:hypothetical protein